MPVLPPWLWQSPKIWISLMTEFLSLSQPLENITTVLATDMGHCARDLKATDHWPQGTVNVASLSPYVSLHWEPSVSPESVQKWRYIVLILQIFLFKRFLLEYSYFTRSYSFLLYWKMNQPCIYHLPFGLPSHSGHHSALGRIPCTVTIQCVLINYPFYT